MTTYANNALAMLIGVDNYRAFDSGGGHDLQGSVNDVRAWWDVCESLGIAPGNVRVFASPAPGAPKLDLPSGVKVEEATRENILKGIAWLAQGVGNQEKRTGLLTYSGHGDVTDQELALCPSDVAQVLAGPSRNLIDFATLKTALGDAAGLTIVLDCCFAGAAANQKNLLSLNRRPLPASILRSTAFQPGTAALSRSPFGGRMLLATGFDQPAYQSNFAGRVHGAFTWALTSELLQWAKVKQDATVRLDVSYGRARQTAETLLTALSYKQTPVLAPLGATNLALLQAGEVPLPTSVVPDAKVISLQADPGQLQVRVYEIVDVNSNLLAYVLVPATTGTYNSHTYDAGTEYWYSVAHSVASLTSMSVSWTDYNWGSVRPIIPNNIPLGTLSFTMTQGATFSSSSAPPNSSSCFVSTGLNVAIDWSLAYSSSSPHWSGSLTWYDTSGLDNVFGSGASSPQTLTASTTNSNSVTWYNATVDPVNPPG